MSKRKHWKKGELMSELEAVLTKEAENGRVLDENRFFENLERFKRDWGVMRRE